MNKTMRNHRQSKPERRRAQNAGSSSAAAEQQRGRKPGQAEAAEPDHPLPAAEAAAPARPGKRSLFKGLFGFLGHNPDHALAEAEAAEAFTVPEQSGWTAQEKRMLASIAELHAARVADIMIPRADIEALELDKTLGEALHLFQQSGHSRLPVYAETLDDPRGMIHIRDVLNYLIGAGFGQAGSGGDNPAGSGPNSGRTFAELDLSRPISRLNIVRDVLFVPASQPAGRLLARMQASRTQMALVIDEHGGTDGLVSMEDIVELIVGDIEDEHDEAEADIVKEAQDSWIIDAAAELEELQESLGVDFAAHAPAQEVDTIGGLIVTALDRIPARGEKVEIMPGYICQILDADRRRVKRLRLIRLEPQAEALSPGI